MIKFSEFFKYYKNTYIKKLRLKGKTEIEREHDGTNYILLK